LQQIKGHGFRVPTNEVLLKREVSGSDLEFDWDEANVRHVANHRVTPEEAEQVILNDPIDLGIEIVEGEDRYLNLGATARGRVLLVVTTWRQDRGACCDGVRADQAADSVLLSGTREESIMTKKGPPFKTENQEAEWWAKNQDLIAERFEQAKATGKLGNGTVARVARERAIQHGASPTITIRLAEDDLARARTLAAEKGLRYQTYLKMLLHQALNSEEKKARRR
jgi:predicted DNA binding CopG/RHH family protein/uncharacterized DUF497 family protein